MKNIYFTPPSDMCSHYLINVLVIEDSVQATVEIYEIDIPQQEIKSGEIYNITPSEEKDIKVVIDLWSKYYFPFFVNQGPSYNQWYHDYDKKCNKNLGFGEVLNFAIQWGLEIANIEKL